MTRVLYIDPSIASQCEPLTVPLDLLPGPDGRTVLYANRDGGWEFEGWVEHMTQTGTLTLVQLRHTLFLLRADTLQHPSITAQEQSILRGIAAGQSYRQIGFQVHLSESTIVQYARRIREKLGAHHRAHLIAIAKDKGII